MKIDVFNHVLPRRFLQRLEETSRDREILKRYLHIPTLWDIDARLRMIDQFDDFQQVISIAGSIEVAAGPEASPGLARLANEEMAEICRRHSDRFPSFIASLPLNNPEASIQEIDYTLDHLHASALQIFTNVIGRPWDDPYYFPILEHAAKRNALIFMHPARGANFADYPSEKTSRYELWWAFGWPYETSVAMARLVYSGIFDKLPNLKIVTHHMGGMVPYFEGRVSPGLDVMGQRTTDASEAPAKLKRRPIEYFKENFYGDTALFGAEAATRCGYEFFGADHCLFASDCPFDPEGGSMFIRETIRVLDSLGLAEQELRKIYDLNARGLLRL